MSKNHKSVVKKKHKYKFPLGYSKLTALSKSTRSKKHRVNYEPSEFHQTEQSMVGIFYKPSAFVMTDLHETK